MQSAADFGDRQTPLSLAKALKIYRGWTETDVATCLRDADQSDRVELAMAIEEEFGAVVDVESGLGQDAGGEKE